MAPTRRDTIRLAAACLLAAGSGCTDAIPGLGGRTGEPEETYRLRVVVENEEGEPVQEVAVSIDSAGGDPLPDTTQEIPDGDGVVEFEVEEGTYAVRATGRQVEDAEREVTVEGSDEEITLTVSEREPLRED